MTELDLMLIKSFAQEDADIIRLHKRISLQKLRLYFLNQLNINISETDLEKDYSSVIFILVSNAIKYSELKGIKSIAQGNKKTTFSDEAINSDLYEITDEIKSYLPLARVRFKG